MILNSFRTCILMRNWKLLIALNTSKTPFFTHLCGRDQSTEPWITDQCPELCLGSQNYGSNNTLLAPTPTLIVAIEKTFLIYCKSKKGSLWPNESCWCDGITKVLQEYWWVGGGGFNAKIISNDNYIKFNINSIFQGLLTSLYTFFTVIGCTF